MPMIKLDTLVIWEDEHLLVVNKPPGLLVLPDGYNPQAPHLRAVLEPTFGPLWIVHRLDRETSGVVILARTAEVHRTLNSQFENRWVSKVYHALVAGNPEWDERTVRLPLRADGDRKHRTVVDLRSGKPSITQFRVLERFVVYTLVEARPKTGRTHQIRAHFACLDAPLVADGLYGEAKGIYLSRIKPGYRKSSARVETPLLGRVGLHNWSLAIKHPESGEQLVFEAPYPKDFALALSYLRKFGHGGGVVG